MIAAVFLVATLYKEKFRKSKKPAFSAGFHGSFRCATGDVPALHGK
jgi:hypothetical protein